MERKSYFGSEVDKYKYDPYLNELSVEDLSSGLSSWHPKYYTCSFCKRVFRTAQALGGHMNVHRRDRARLKSHLPSWVYGYTTPNPNSNPSSSTLEAPSSSKYMKSLTDDHQQGHRLDPFYIENEQLMKKKSMIATKFKLGFSQPKCKLGDHQELIKEKKEIISLDLEMGFKDQEEILDLELRLGQ